MYQQGYRPPTKPSHLAAKKADAKKRTPAPAPNEKPAPQSAMTGYRHSPNGAMVLKKGHKSGLGRVLFLVLTLGILAFGAFYLKTWLEVRPYDNIFVPNVFVDNIDLGGMTAKDGVAAVRAGARNRTEGLSIRLMAENRVYAKIDSTMLGITYDTDTALNAAWAIGHNGTVFDRKREIDRVRVQGFKAFSAMPGANTQPVDSMLVQLKNDFYRAPHNASFSFNPDATVPFTFVPEERGVSIDIEPLKQQIYEKVSAMESGDVQIVPTYTEPDETVEELAQKVALRYSATTPVDPKSTDNRTNNIRKAFEKISGTVLKPGEKFSFNNEVGWRTEKNGFFPAPEYANGELEEGIGGGVCQASTTLYLAAICAGLEIVDREPHSDPVSYTELGKDATVFLSSNRKIDFVFRNNTEDEIYITAAVKTDPANRKRFISVVSIYGLSMGDVSYELVAREIEKIPAPTETEPIKDKQHKYVTYVDEQYEAFKARDGHVVVSELVKKINGEEVERKQVSKDTYTARAARIYIGTKERE